MRALARADLGQPSEPLTQPPLWKPSTPVGYLKLAWIRYRRWGVYPDGKCYDEQNADLLDDFGQLQYRENFYKQEEMAKKRK